MTNEHPSEVHRMCQSDPTMTSSRDLRSRVTDIVTCPICLQLFENPKSLPCLHAFCLNCLQSHFGDLMPEDEAECPVCRTKFKISPKGLDGLVHNFFIETLVDARRTSTGGATGVGDTPCEVCTELGGRNTVVPESTVFCVDCSQKLCEVCSRPHRKMKGGPHRVIPLGSEVEDELIRTRGANCEKHKDETVKLYCFNCKTNICLVCSAVEHEHHKRQDIDKVAAECVKQIDDDVKPVTQYVSDARKELERLDDEKIKLLGTIDDVSVKIEQKADELKLLIDRHVSVLQIELQSVKSETCKEIESHRERVELAVSAMGSFINHCVGLKSKGKPSDITRAANNLHARATELLQTDVTLDGYSVPYVTFTPVNINELMARQNIVGEVHSTKCAGNFMPSVKPLKVLPSTGQWVSGVATLGDELFVVRHGSRHVDVYDVTTFKSKRHLALPTTATTHNHGLAACDTNKCVYVSDNKGNYIHKIDVFGKTPATQWTVDADPRGVSLNNDRNVLVACRRASKIQEYSPTVGALIRTISLPSNITRPTHVIQLSSGQYGVIHEGSTHGYCVVDGSDQVVKSYTRSRGAGSGQFYKPGGFAVNKRGFVFIADWRNHRIVVLDPDSLTSTVLSIEGGVNNPSRIHLDESRQCMYIGEWNWWGGGRVIELGHALSN